jgi:hypothetical protein
VTIDASGELDGIPFRDAWELGEAVRQHPNLVSCLVRTMYRYATSSIESVGELGQLEVLKKKLERSGYQVQGLMRDVALSQGFRLAAEEQP